MKQNLRSVLVLKRQNRGTSEVHQLDVLAAAVQQPKRRFAQLIEDQILLVVGDAVVDDDQVVELVEELRDAVRLEHEVAHEVLQL